MPTDATLTKGEKNLIFEMIQRRGFDPADFDWREMKSEEWSGLFIDHFTVSQLIHSATGYYFTFGGHTVTACPGKLRKIESEVHKDDWTIKSGAFDSWLTRLKAEVEAPDLWVTIGQEKVLMAAASAPNLNNSPFNHNEQALVTARLDEIKRYLLDGQQFDTEQAELIDRVFDYLRESSIRMGRKDWLNILLGGLMGLAFSLVLDPEKARGLLALAGTAFQSLWGVAQAYLQ